MRCSSSRSSSARVQAAGGALGLERLDDLHRRGHAHVGRDQQLLETLPDALVVGIEGELVEPLRERTARAAQVLAQAREEAAAALLGLGGTLGRGRQPEQDRIPFHYTATGSRVRRESTVETPSPAMETP